jgi:hypothetical protein
MMHTISRGQPFGHPACEAEVKSLKSDYSGLYFDEIPFTDACLKPETYLIVGRRGSGKTALAQYLSFQRKIPSSIYVPVDRPDSYHRVLAEVASRASESREMAIKEMQNVWEYLLWPFILETAKTSTLLHRNVEHNAISDRVAQRIRAITDGSILDSLWNRTHTGHPTLDQQLQNLLGGSEFLSAKAQVLKIARITPIIVTLDTLEQYDVSNRHLMNAMAALIECAAEFNLTYSHDGLHLKLFMSGEALPHLEEEVLLNTLKSIKDPVYLLWRPKDLLRLISWRLYRFLKRQGLLRAESAKDINWTNHHEVLAKMWIPYFGEYVTNSLGKREHTFSYVLRHTQMRPRQLIVLCNSIANRAYDAGGFPRFSEDDIRNGVREAESRLAVEIINSFSSLYPNVSRIIDALGKMPKVFIGSDRDKRAKESAAAWPRGSYSPSSFKRLVAELGIVGRVMRRGTSGYIDADFEYSRKDRLPIRHDEECVIHPMFYTRLDTLMNSAERVMPFSTDREENIEAVWRP